MVENKPSNSCLSRHLPLLPPHIDIHEVIISKPTCS
jgi:hypothetical protein